MLFDAAAPNELKPSQGIDGVASRQVGGHEALNTANCRVKTEFQ